ncbi:MAG: fumarylacetoacetate hydrolase family protein [Parvibaculum sp.]|uniref:fumarylacetoacetate hydrolase family protein n=1 Tax=Parvibaculum sp. TaxID=2024848 RepID=UPI002731C3BE|nr:fumarylacetoacetate hydrolase family protein [Parvibaculum sp.]MDP2151312.1 fumarylacetoacetate hydrolase family protein [Parvibaculum sp.]
MTYAVQIRPQPVVPVDGSDQLFPVRRILCVGRNYAAHRREMGGDDRDPPFFFSKPADAIVPPGADVPYPSATGDLHHEIELVVAIGEGGAIFGFAVGVDLTRRDLQNGFKAKGQPWDAAKGFDASAPISAIRPFDGAIPQGRIALSVNGEIRQQAQVADMIWSVEEIIAEAGKLWALEPGDLIYTGTPEGVAALQRGDTVTGAVEGVGTLAFRIV